MSANPKPEAVADNGNQLVCTRLSEDGESAAASALRCMLDGVRPVWPCYAGLSGDVVAELESELGCCPEGDNGGDAATLGGVVAFFDKAFCGPEGFPVAFVEACGLSRDSFGDLEVGPVCSSSDADLGAGLGGLVSIAMKTTDKQPGG